MKAILEKATQRGHSHIDWMDAYYSFSYGEYNNPNRMKFGVLRFLNDFTIAIDKSIRIKNAQNIILVTLPLKGSLHHSDSYGHEDMVRWGQTQIMNTGTGTVTSEYTNKSEHHLVEFIQIGIIPKKMDTAPAHEIIDFSGSLKEHSFVTIIAPHGPAAGKIDQQASISLGEFHHGDSVEYKCHTPGNGVFVLLLGGSMELSGYQMDTKDSIEITDFDKLEFSFSKNSTVLLIEVPMQ